MHQLSLSFVHHDVELASFSRISEWSERCNQLLRGFGPSRISLASKFSSVLHGGEFGRGALWGAAAAGIVGLVDNSYSVIRNSPGKNSGFDVRGGSEEMVRFQDRLSSLRQDPQSAEIVQVAEARGLRIDLTENYQNGE
jgi:hypothetical protein